VTPADDKLVRNERTKLTAGYLNTAATTLLGAGVVAPLVAGIYGLVGAGQVSSPLTLAAGLTMFLAMSAITHVAARLVLGRLET
jgi:ABC-type transport system involved in cytochrome bd biosynthesis fused ATPase/permease subunit